MSPEKQRIAIAEACGWKSVGYSLAGLGGYAPRGYEQNPLPSPEAHPEDWRLRFDKKIGEQWFSLPDYLNDLNAMHEAEKILTEEDQWKQILLLAGNPDETKMGLIELRKVVRATAAQRAEAFLKTIGKWENE